MAFLRGNLLGFLPGVSLFPSRNLTVITRKPLGFTAKRAVRGAWRSAVLAPPCGFASYDAKIPNEGNK